MMIAWCVKGEGMALCNCLTFKHKKKQDYVQVPGGSLILGPGAKSVRICLTF